jgi:hypothetical protein
VASSIDATSAGLPRSSAPASVGSASDGERVEPHADVSAAKASHWKGIERMNDPKLRP